MTTFNVHLVSSSGAQYVRSGWGADAQSAMERIEREENAPVWAGERSAKTVAAEQPDYWAADGGYLVHKTTKRAVKAEVCRTDYVACGAYVTATGEFIDRV